MPNGFKAGKGSKSPLFALFQYNAKILINNTPKGKSEQQKEPCQNPVVRFVRKWGVYPQS